MVKIPVKALVRKPILYVNFPGTSRREAIEVISRDKGCGIALVRRDTQEFMGYIPAVKMLAHPEEQQLTLLVEKAYPTLQVTSSIREAAELMVKHGVWEVPVVEGSKYVGMVRATDLLRYVVASKVKVEIGEFQSRSYPMAWQGTPITVIGKLMEFYNEPVVVILGDDGEPIGGVFIQDLLVEGEVETEESSLTLGGMSEGEDWDWNVSKVVVISKSKFKLPLKLAIDIMKSLPKIYIKTPLTTAAKTLMEKGVQLAFTVDARGRVEGFISCMNILKAYVKFST